MLASLLINVGTPNSYNDNDVKQYLTEFLMDKHVITVPFFLRYFIVKNIVNKRFQYSAKMYQEIWQELGSPLKVNMQNLTNLLNAKSDNKVFFAMRYGEPSIKEVLTQITDEGFKELTILPLYPQFAHSTTQSAIYTINKELKNIKSNIKVKFLDYFYQDPTYIQILAQTIKPHIAGDEYVLFSYHGVPHSHILRYTKKIDAKHDLYNLDAKQLNHQTLKYCYKSQCLHTSLLLAKQLNIAENRYTTTFQSRVGNEKWTTPTTKDTIKNIAQIEKKLLVISPSFVSDCIETIYELDNMAKQIFLENGGETFARIGCLNDNELWVHYLAEKINSSVIH